jgi:Predicted membrane protein (DUF2207) C-terminal domain
MRQFNAFISGYEPAVLALVFVLAYFFLAALILSAFQPQSVVVPRYEPPHGASPGVAAWLFERGDLARAMAAALVNMAAKTYLQIEQRGDLYSVTQLGPDVSLSLEPEEDALARTVFKGYDCFDFDDPTPQLKSALGAFAQALVNTGYSSRRTVLSVPAWVASGLGLAFVLLQGNYLAHSNRGITNLIVLAFGCFVVAIRTLPETLAKIVSWFPGSTAPKRPWSGSDSMTFTLLLAGLGGVAALAILSTTTAALLAAAFLGINAVFFHTLQGPTAAGRKVMAQLAEYKKFLEEVEANSISRMNSCETAPSEFTEKHAYAIAFHLDLGWGEQFVGCVADLVERAEVFSKILRPRNSET